MHSVIRALARVLYREAAVELLRLWTPSAGDSGGSGGEGGYGGTGGSGAVDGRAGGTGSSRGGGGGSGPDRGGTGERFGGGQLRVRWRATGHPWLPWSEEQRIEVIATYRFDPRGLIFAHELTTVIPPEPPLLLWPLLAVVRMLGRVPANAARDGGGGRPRMPMPGAGAGLVGGEGTGGGGGGGGGLAM
ncbi:hypothetical protein GPECTOR_3g236 [Gonium pectorale]|uniref:Uncharacterized protein n=1 Tax=Gonium pectorale TaxID=33097 RepID=A0A150H0J0_GONPE|nr:hypothetical protein GPECTOR_3g236 [Gonium pectorale]|eukprot:KXZ55080.1 hypothetical protein GPECTOR_3g236 [Gonium pectorale]